MSATVDLDFDRPLTARASRTFSRVLRRRLFAVTVKRRLLLTRALGLRSTDALAASSAAAGRRNSHGDCRSAVVMCRYGVALFYDVIVCGAEVGAL